MASTKDEILTELIAAKDADPILSTIFTSSSKAAVYYSLFVLISEFAGDFELTYDDFVAEIDALLESKQVHTDAWWQRTALAFQYGDSLVIFDNGNLGYETEDTDLQIIKRAAVETTGEGLVTLKVAKLDTDDITPIPLITAEKSAFDSYVNDVTPSGIVVTVISVDGDEIRVALDVEIDSQVINVSDGTLLSDGTTKPVEDAIYNYLATFQADDFGGTFYANNLMAMILAANGVVNATFSTLTKKGANEVSFSDVLTLTGKKFGTYSGYVLIESAWDLSANITYTAAE